MGEKGWVPLAYVKATGSVMDPECWVNIIKLGRAQKWFTRLLPGLEGFARTRPGLEIFSYKERLDRQELIFTGV